MAFALTSVLIVEQVSKNGCCQHLCHLGYSHLLLASPGGSSRSASVSDPGFSQITASVLGLGACEILFMPFKSNLFPVTLLFSSTPAPLSSKPDVLGAHDSEAGSPGWKTQCGAWTPGSLGRTSAIVIILPFVDYLLKGVGLNSTTSLLLLPVLLQFLPYFFSCGKSLLLDFRLFSSTVAL